MPPVGGKREIATLKYPKDLYNYSVLKMAQPLTEQEIRVEYSRLRSIAQKRLIRLSKSEWGDSQIYLNNKDMFPKLSEIQNDSEVMKRLSILASFISSQRSSISGLNKERKKNIETLKEHGYDFVTKKNYKRFANYMEDVRIYKASMIYDSERVAELFKTAEKKKISKSELFRDFESWENKLEELDKLDTKNKNGKPMTASQIRKELGIKQPRKRKG